VDGIPERRHRAILVDADDGDDLPAIGLPVGSRGHRRLDIAIHAHIGLGDAPTSITTKIQRSLATGANEVFTFGRHEGAIAHFHRQLDAALAAL
jgi:hypothetical protein